MHALLTPVGSSGDVHPFIALGLALRARGHRVSFVANGHFGPLIQRVGLDFVEFGTADEYDTMLTDPDLWHPTRGFAKIMDRVLGVVPDAYQLVAEYHSREPITLVSSALAFGARIAHERLGISLATIHLQPSVFRSVTAPPRMPAVWMPQGSPRWYTRLLYWMMDAAVIDRVVAPPINRFRAELGLPPVKRALDRWWHSPQCVIGLFPPWFAPPQPDWPPNTFLTGFPLWDERGVEPVDQAVEGFLDAGTPPIVFTPGSAMRHGRAFFDAAVAACDRLDRRGILLTRYRDHLPADLPNTVRHFDYVPLSQLLPRAAALVHHGGIGTTAQALAAGTPQLLMPMGFDQPDNAERIARLGVGDWLPPKRFRKELAESLHRILDNPDVAENCRNVAGRIEGTNPIDEACAHIEKIADES